jgi:hypothetical protein
LVSPKGASQLINNDNASEQIHNCKFHLYVDSFQPYTVDLGRDVDSVVRFVNEDLERSCFWAAVNFLVLYMSKTQAMLISRRDRGAVLEHSLTVAGHVVVFPSLSDSDES